MAFQWLSEDYCCETMKFSIENNWPLGSHYHCGECGGLCSMMGHLKSIHTKIVNGQTRWVDVEEHYCCDPQNCKY